MTKILIIRFRRVGDSVISSSLCSSLKESFPDSEIHYIVNEHIATLYEHHPDIDKVISFTNEEMHSITAYIKKCRRIVKETKYDIIIDTRSTIKTLFFSIFSLGTKYRIGRSKKYNYLIHNHRVNNKYDGIRDNAQLTLALLDPLNTGYIVKKNPHFKLYYTTDEYNKYRGYMESKGIDFSKPVIVCAVTARLEYKVWDKEKMRTILERIINKYDAQLVFNFGDNKEKEAAQHLHQIMNNDPHIFTNIEANNLRELIALLANSNFFFGNEGGTRHISQALDIPSFAIYPPNIPLNNWLPNKSEKFQGIELKDVVSDASNYESLSYSEKFALIDIESVWERADRMLEKYI